MACSPTMSSRPLADTQRRSLGVPKSHCVTIGIPGQASDAARPAARRFRGCFEIIQPRRPWGWPRTDEAHQKPDDAKDNRGEGAKGIEGAKGMASTTANGERASGS